MGCHVVKSSYAGLNNEQYIYHRNIGSPSSQASAAAMDNNQEVIVDTQPQTQSQSTNAWTNMDSQPIENVIWGRLYPKSVKLKSLGTPHMIDRSSMFRFADHEHFISSYRFVQ